MTAGTDKLSKMCATRIVTTSNAILHSCKRQMHKMICGGNKRKTPDRVIQMEKSIPRQIIIKRAKTRGPEAIEVEEAGGVAEVAEARGEITTPRTTRDKMLAPFISLTDPAQKETNEDELTFLSKATITKENVSVTNDKMKVIVIETKVAGLLMKKEMMALPTWSRKISQLVTSSRSAMYPGSLLTWAF